MRALRRKKKSPAEPPEARAGEDKLGLKQVVKRRIATAAMDELQTAIYKATTDDKLQPKEKHVLSIVRLATEADSSAQAGAELLRRLRDCREPRAASVAAKTLVVLHRVLLAGGGDCLREAGVSSELALVCSDGAAETRHAQADSCNQAAAYLQQLCGLLCGEDAAATLRDHVKEHLRACLLLHVEVAVVLLEDLLQQRETAFELAV